LPLGLLLVVGAGVLGCRWGARRTNVEERSVIEGISVFELDGLDVRVKHGADARGLYLVVNGQVVQEVRLRAGDSFVVTNGRDVHEAYQLLIVDQDRITLKRQTVFDRRQARDGVRTVETVVAIPPYNLEEGD
jgi:hypothetical protein